MYRQTNLLRQPENEEGGKKKAGRGGEAKKRKKQETDAISLFGCFADHICTKLR